MLERTVASCLDALDEYHDETIDRRPYARTENLSSLAVALGRMLEGRGKFVLVLDGVDKQREAPYTLLPALARFGESVCSYCTASAHVTNIRARYPTFASSSSQRYLYRLNSTVLEHRISTFQRTTATLSSQSWAKILRKSSFSRRTKRNFRTTRPIWRPKMTLGFGGVSQRPYTMH